MYTLVDQQFGYVRLAAPLLDLVGISTELCGAISTQFCFSYSLGGRHYCSARATRWALPRTSSLFWSQKVKGQGHESQKTVPAWVFVLL